MEDKDSWTIREYREGDEHGILKLFNLVFAIGNPDFVPRSLRHWRWQFAENPEGHHTFVADQDGEIIGTYTGIPCRWRFPEGVGLGAQAVDTVVHPDFRRSLKRTGLFLTLAYHWFDHFARPDRDRIVYGFPNPQAFRIGTTKVDYRPVHCPVPELSCPIDQARSWEAQARARGIEVGEVLEFGTEAGELDRELAPFLGISSVRDARYLNWRFARHPSTRYRLLRAEGPGGNLKGFLVHALSWNGDRKNIVPLVDWLVRPGDPWTFRALIGNAASCAQRHGGLDLLLTWAPPNHRHFADLQELGFVRTDSRFNLCIRIFTPTFDVPYAVSNWYVNMGDSDIF